jgi:hypothetical protein
MSVKPSWTGGEAENLQKDSPKSGNSGRQVASPAMVMGGQNHENTLQK